MNKNIKYSQNFLTSEKVLNQIIKQLNLKETDVNLAVGDRATCLLCLRKSSLLSAHLVIAG